MPAPEKKRVRFASIPETIFARAVADGLTAGEFQVLAAILLCVNWRTGEAWPTIGRLRQITGRSKDTVTEAKAKLQEKGYIDCAWREVKGGGHIMRVLFDLDGNHRKFPTQTAGKIRTKPTGFSVSNQREKPPALPTVAIVASPSYQSHEHSHEQSQGSDLFFRGKCSHLSDSRQRSRLDEAIVEFGASPSGEAFLVARSLTDFQAQVNRKILHYHEQREHRGIACDYAGCIRLPAEKIAAMTGAKSNPLAYLEKSLEAGLGKEEDRAQETRALAAQARQKDSGTRWEDALGGIRSHVPATP